MLRQLADPHGLRIRIWTSQPRTTGKDLVILKIPR